MKDPELAQKVKDFIGQEGQHRNVNQMLNELGWDASGIEAHSTCFVKKYINTRLAKYPLVMTCDLEHFTSILANCLLTNPEVLADTSLNWCVL